MVIGSLLRDRARHRLARADRLAEVAAQGQADPAQVLDGQRVVQAVLLADLLEAGGVGLGAGQHARGVARESCARR